MPANKKGATAGSDYCYLGFPPGTSSVRYNSLVHKIPGLLKLVQAAHRLQRASPTTAAPQHKYMDCAMLKRARENRRCLETDRNTAAFGTALEAVCQRMGKANFGGVCAESAQAFTTFFPQNVIPYRTVLYLRINTIIICGRLKQQCAAHSLMFLMIIYCVKSCNPHFFHPAPQPQCIGYARLQRRSLVLEAPRLEAMQRLSKHAKESAGASAEARVIESNRRAEKRKRFTSATLERITAASPTGTTMMTAAGARATATDELWAAGGRATAEASRSKTQYG